MRRHESAGSDFNVHNERIQIRRNFLRQNRSCYQRNRLNGTRDVTYSIESPVCWREIICLADDGATDFFNNLAKLGEVRRGVVARNGFCFVGRTPGMPQTAPGNHRHETTTSRHDRREHEADFVAYTAGRMFIDDWSTQVEILPLQYSSGISHAHG